MTPSPPAVDRTPGPSAILYLHGFRSSPKSAKAQQMAAWMAAHRPDVEWWCPQLPPSPREAMAMVAAHIDRWPADRMAVVGSSLGGFYATWVAERTGCPAVLLNPAVDPARDLATHIGEQTTWQDPSDRFFFRAEFIPELQALTVPAITRAGRYFAVIAKGDEVLDWREMVGRYPGANVKLLDRGDHALSDFDRHLPDVLKFLRLEPRGAAGDGLGRQSPG